MKLLNLLLCLVCSISVFGQSNTTATTQHYLVQNLNCAVNGSNYLLKSPDGKLVLHDCVTNPICKLDESTIPKMPTTITNSDSNAIVDARQAFHSVGVVISKFAELNPKFGTVNITVTNDFGAEADTDGSTSSETKIAFGKIEGRLSSVYDIVAHELGHIYIMNYIYDGNHIISEGLCDIIAEYIESKIYSTNDWMWG